MEPKVTIGERTITIEREVDAPAQLVWKALTDPNLIVQWWGPDGFTNTIEKMEIRPGGQWHLIMHGPDGTNYPNQVIYDEVSEPSRLVFHHLGAPELDFKGFQTTITLTEQDGKTVISLYNEFASAEELEKQIKKANAVEGGKQTLGRLAEFLSQK